MSGLSHISNRISVINLLGIVLLEEHEDWISSGRRYMGLNSLRSVGDQSDESGPDHAEVEKPECVALNTPR